MPDRWRAGTIPSERRPTPRQDAARALADAVVRALDGGDVVGARAAAAALVEFIDALAGVEAEAAADRGATGT